MTEIPTDPKSTRQIFFHADGVFHLSTGPSATLTVYEPGTWKRLWSVKDLTGVSEMAGPYAHHRLLCKADDALFVIDTKQQKLLAKISPPQFKGEGCWFYQTEKNVLVLCQGMGGERQANVLRPPRGQVALVPRGRLRRRGKYRHSWRTCSHGPNLKKHRQKSEELRRQWSRCPWKREKKYGDGRYPNWRSNLLIPFIYAWKHAHPDLL